MLCENEVGYKNLCALITQSYTKGLKNNEPVIDSKWLDGQTEGLIAISSYNSGYFQQSKSSDLTISSEKEGKAEIWDFNGRLVDRVNIRIGNNELNELESGIYVVQVVWDDGQIAKSERLIVFYSD